MEKADESTEVEVGGEAPEGAPAAELEALRAEVQSQARRLDEISRAYAEVLNDREAFRKRLEREKERQVEASKVEAVQMVLEALDDLRRALAGFSAADDTAAGGALAEGVRLTADGLQRRLISEGLTPIEAEGRPFDPMLHEAVDLVPTTDAQADGMVIEESRGGWLVGNRVIRPARVRVARLVPATDDSPEP